MTLTQTAFLVKRGIIISSVLLVLGIVGFISYKIWYANYLANLPPVEEKPDLKFGPLSPIDFPKTDVTSSNFTYSIDTVTGGLPKIGIDPGFDKLIKVYFVTKTITTFLSSDRSQALAGKFDIKTPPEILSETKYKFTDNDKTLMVNLDNGNFSYQKQATISSQISIDDDVKLISDFTQTLSSLGVYKQDFQGGRNKITVLDPTGIIQISLWPAPIDKKLIYTPEFNKSLVASTVLGQANNLDNFLSLDFTYYPVDTSTFATYPTKLADAAFEDLKSGKGIVVIEPDKPQVSITSVDLGYFMPENYNPYLQPIFIFQGPNFVAYVDAISGQHRLEAR